MTGIEAGKEVMDETRAAFEKAGFTLPKIAKEIALIAFSDMAEFVDVNEGGELSCKSFDSIKKNKTRIIKKIRENTKITESKDGAKIFKESKVEYELHSKLDAMQMALDVMGLNKPVKVDMNHSGSLMAEVVKVLAGGANEKPT